MLSVRLLVDRGPRDLPERRPELLDLAMDVLVREHQAGAAVATDVAPRASCGTDGCTLGVDCLARSLDASLRVLADLALRPKYPSWQQGRLRQDHDTWMLHLRSSTDGALTTNARALLFAPGDVSAPPWPGAPSPIGPTTMADLRETHAQLFQPAHATLVVAGDTTLEALAPAAERAFGAWTATRPVVPRVTAQTPLPAPGPRLVLVPQPSDLAHAYLAARAPADNEAALDAVWLVAVLLSMPDGDLSEQVRSHLGAVYTLSLQRREGRAGSWFLLGGAFEPSRLVPAITAIVAAVRAVRDQGVSPAALETARTRMVAMLRESTGTADGATSAIIAALSAGLAPETVLTRHARHARLTPEIVQKVAQVWLAEDLLRVVVIGNAHQIAHPFTELALGAPDWRNAAAQPITR